MGLDTPTEQKYRSPTITIVYGGRDGDGGGSQLLRAYASKTTV